MEVTNDKKAVRNETGLETDCCTISIGRALLPALLGTTANPHRATVAERTSEVTGTHNLRRTPFASCPLLSPSTLGDRTGSINRQ